MAQQSDADEYRNEPYRFRAVRAGAISMLPLVAPAPALEAPRDESSEQVLQEAPALGLCLVSGLTRAASSPTTPMPTLSGPTVVIPLPPLKVPTPPRSSSSSGPPSSSDSRSRTKSLPTQTPTPPPKEARVGPPAPRPARRHVAAVVQFKYTDGVFELPEYDPEIVTFAPGDYVVVEAERGEHIGRIQQCNLAHRHKVDAVGRILRQATRDDVEALRVMRGREMQASLHCQSAADQHGVPMRVFDTEIQLDFLKVTIYYVPSIAGVVDFRLLQRYLFRLFQCRIWFVNCNTIRLTVPASAPRVVAPPE